MHCFTGSYEMAMRFIDIRKRVYTFPKMGEKAYFIAVPTSAGTGSEVTPFAVITDETTGTKYPLYDAKLDFLSPEFESRQRFVDETPWEKDSVKLEGKRKK